MGIASVLLAAGADPEKAAFDIAKKQEHLDLQELLMSWMRMFTVVTYNVLAKSLGSNCIPWAMDISATLCDKVSLHTEQHQKMSWDEWRKAKLGPAYKVCWPWRKLFAS